MYLHHNLSTKVKYKVLVSQQTLRLQLESKSPNWEQTPNLSKAACAGDVYHFQELHPGVSREATTFSPDFTGSLCCG